MKKELNVLLSGLGFSALSSRRKKLLLNLLVISLGIHLLGLLIFGGWVVMTTDKDQKTVFVAPPPMKRYEPRKLEHRVKVQKRQRSSSRPSMIPKMVSTRPSELSLPEIKLDAKVINSSFQPKFKAVSGIGMGAGLGTGYGVGGFGTGVSAFNFFGIRGRGDKIAILVDISVSMVEEERGGGQGFQRVKERIGEVVDALNPSAMFNVIVFANAASAWQTDMQVATAENKQEVKRFLRPFNTKGNWGLSSGNLKPARIGVPSRGGTTRLDLALTAAFEQNADTILILSDGEPQVKKALTDEERREFAEQRRDWHERNQHKMEQWDRNVKYKTQRVWVEPKAAVTVDPNAPPREGENRQSRPAVEGHWETRRVPVGPPRPQPPQEPDPGVWNLNEFIHHFEILHQNLYEKKGKKLPTVHCIGYQIDSDGRAFLRRLAREYKGNYRSVGRLR